MSRHASLSWMTRRPAPSCCRTYSAFPDSRVRLADAQQQKAAIRIAYVYIFKEGPSAPFTLAFTQRMRELVDSKVDVIVTACTPEAKVAVKFTSTIPIVVAATGDPVTAGLVSSLARPGGNVTGVSAMLLDLSAKRMAILKEAFPKGSRATVLWNPGRPDNVPEVLAMQDAAKALGVRLDSQPVRTRA